MTRLSLHNIEKYLNDVEAPYPDIRDGLQKEVIWAGEPATKTDFALVYIHGFSASKGELRPLPDMIANALDANLFYTRLPGHGRSSRAMGETTKEDWYDALDEAITIGQKIGHKIVILSCSTGGTLLTAGLKSPHIAQAINATVFFAPNFGVQDPTAWTAYLPGFRYWAHFIAGRRIGFEPRNEINKKLWTSQYPPRAVIPMMQLIKDVRKVDLSKVTVPSLFVYSDEDKIVKPQKTKKIRARWGGIADRLKPDLKEGDDENAHILAGNALSPSQNEPLSLYVTAWIKENL